MQWHPIETAPKDGRLILLADYEDMDIGYWNVSLNRWYDMADVGYVDGEWPTHWMPLPPLPPLP